MCGAVSIWTEMLLYRCWSEHFLASMLAKTAWAILCPTCVYLWLLICLTPAAVFGHISKRNNNETSIYGGIQTSCLTTSDEAILAPQACPLLMSCSLLLLLLFTTPSCYWRVCSSFSGSAVFCTYNLLCMTPPSSGRENTFCLRYWPDGFISTFGLV